MPIGGFRGSKIASDDWFEVYQVAPDLFAFYEPRHYEQTLVNLVIGEHTAALIDTGCGIGDLRRAVEEVTDKPVIVINTHTHLDHLGSNRQFQDIAMLDHPAARRVAKRGVSNQIVQTEILADGLVTGLGRSASIRVASRCHRSTSVIG